MQVEIVTMSQEMDLSDGSMSHFIVLRLPTGVIIKGLISDESASQIVHAKVTGSPAPKKQTQEVFVDPTAEGGDVVFFGGTPSADNVVIPVVESTPKPRIKAARVDKDEYGYPILYNKNGVDAREVSGGGDLDEEGVGQL